MVGEGRRARARTRRGDCGNELQLPDPYPDTIFAAVLAGLKPGECSANGKLTIEFGECLGACEMAPCVLEGDDLVADVTNEKADAMIAKYK